MRRCLRTWWPLLLAMAACSAQPPLRTYVLAPPTEQVAFSPTVTGTIEPAERIWIRRVRVPDYLDTTDIVLRDGRNEVKPSATGRWAERLSAVLTHALVADLVARLPPDTVAIGRSSQAYRQLLISVDAVELWPDGRCVLSASWSISDHNASVAVISGSGTFETPASGNVAGVGGAGSVESISRALARLSDAIAPYARLSTGSTFPGH